MTTCCRADLTARSLQKKRPGSTDGWQRVRPSANGPSSSRRSRSAFAFVKATDPAPAVARRVMSHIHSPIESISARRASIAARQEAGMSQAGHAKKVIWGSGRRSGSRPRRLARQRQAGHRRSRRGHRRRGEALCGAPDCRRRREARGVRADHSGLPRQRGVRARDGRPRGGGAAGRPGRTIRHRPRTPTHSDAPSPVDNAAIAAVIDDPSFVVLVTNPAFETSWDDAAKKVTEMKSAVGQGQLAAERRRPE